MLKLKDLIDNSNTDIQSFKINKETHFYKQCSDKELKKTSFIAKIEEVYDGQFVLKRNNIFYIDIGWDNDSNGNLFIPVEGYPLNIIMKQ